MDKSRGFVLQYDTIFTVYVSYRSYCTAVQCSTYFRSEFVLPYVFSGQNTAVFTAYTLLATLSLWQEDISVLLYSLTIDALTN